MRRGLVAEPYVMTRRFRGSSDYSHQDSSSGPDAEQSWAPSPGKVTLTSMLPPRRNTEARPAAPLTRWEIRRAVDTLLLLAEEMDGTRDDRGVRADADPLVNRAAASSGTSLPSPVKEKFEAALGADLNDVRVHTGPESAEAAAAVGAKAYTSGQDIHFSAGRYDPSSAEGEKLLAHEVAHTVQQASGSTKRQHKLEVSAAGDAHELEADRAADAMVRGQPATVTSATAGVARAAQGAERDLTENDRGMLQSGMGLLSAASQNLQALQLALMSYSGSAPSCLSSLKSAFDATTRVYEMARATVERKIRMAKEDADTRALVINTLIDAAFAAVTGGIGAYVEKIGGVAQKVHDGLSSIPGELLGGAVGNMAPSPMSAIEGAIGGGLHVGAPGTGGAVGGGPSELEFLRMFTSLQSKAMSLLPFSLSATNIAGPLGELKGAMSGVIAAGKTRSDYPIDKMMADAMAFDNGCRMLASAAPGVAALLPELQALAAQTQAAMPTSVEKIEQELLVKWMATLKEEGSADLMDEDRMEEYIRLRDVFDRLGVNVGDYFSGDDELVMICTSLAHSRVLAHRGTSLVVRVTQDHGLSVEGGLPGLSYLPIRLESRASPGRWRAVLIGSTAIKPVTQEILQKTAWNKDAIATYLLEKGYIAGVWRVYEELPANSEEG